MMTEEGEEEKRVERRKGMKEEVKVSKKKGTRRKSFENE